MRTRYGKPLGFSKIVIMQQIKPAYIFIFDDHMKIQSPVLVPLGFGKYVRSDRVTALVPIEEEKSPSRFQSKDGVGDRF